jgi:hypothetical protein
VQYFEWLALEVHDPVAHAQLIAEFIEFAFAKMPHTAQGLIARRIWKDGCHPGPFLQKTSEFR